jgi:hypothetical protein
LAIQSKKSAKRSVALSPAQATSLGAMSKDVRDVALKFYF